MSFHRTMAAVATAALLVPAAAGAETVKVGFMATLSGVGAELGQTLQRGFNLALQESQQDLGEHKIEVVTRDLKDPSGANAKTAAQELITRERVKILTGFVYSPNAIAVAPIITEAKMPAVIMNAGTAWITTLSPYFARVSFSMWQAGYPMGQYAAQKMGAKTAVVGYTDYPPGKDSTGAFQRGFEAAGGKVIDAIPMGGPGQVPDFTPFFQRVKDAKPDVFYIFVPGGAHSTAVAKTYANLGMKDAGIKLIGPGDITQDTKLQAMGKPAEGMITVHHYTANLETPENKKFVEAWKKAYGADSVPDFVAIGGYNGGKAIVHAIKATNGKMEPDAVMDALKGWQYTGPQGPVMISEETRDVVDNQYVMTVVSEGDILKMKVLDTIPNVEDPCKAMLKDQCAPPKR